VGRLDRPSEGLMLLTNDGELANRLMHPRYEVRKRYQVTVQPRLTARHVKQALAGIELEDGPARLLELEVAAEEAQRSWLTVTISEGRNRLIRRLFEALGYEVLRLKRVQLGALSLGKLGVGQTRPLSAAEAASLRASVGLDK
jgi:23S rRNA pseudouridine2605 synthase